MPEALSRREPGAAAGDHRGVGLVLLKQYVH
jgi:hypothetical protein